MLWFLRKKQRALKVIAEAAALFAGVWLLGCGEQSSVLPPEVTLSETREVRRAAAAGDRPLIRRGFAWTADRWLSILPSMALLARTEPVPLREDSDGVIRVGGTRVSLDTVLTAYRQGSTPEQIAEDYSSLDIADVYAAIAYYLRHREEVEEYLARRRRFAEAVREELRERFPSEGIRERLESRLR